MTSPIFSSYDQLETAFRRRGCDRLLIIRLSQNDSPKTQIVVGADWDRPALNAIPHAPVTGSNPNTKAKVHFSWLEPDGLKRAPKAKLARYPRRQGKSSEIRLSGILDGSGVSFGDHFSGEVARASPDRIGRHLVLGVGAGNSVVAVLAAAQDPISRDIGAAFDSGKAIGRKVREVSIGVAAGRLAARSWSLLTVRGHRTHQGNEGYADKPEEIYQWDTTVANHAAVEVGDTVVVRDNDAVLGIAVIETLAVTRGETKQRFRCPECRSTSLRTRMRKTPKYRCADCGESFGRPDAETITVDAYQGFFGESWRGLKGDLQLEKLEAITGGSYRQSIRPIASPALSDLLNASDVISRPWDVIASRLAERGGGSSPTGGTRAGKGHWRVGQAAFRDLLLNRDGAVCAITGPQPKAILDAAHWVPFAETQSHELTHGLLLRKDIHRLVDRNDVTICPDDWTVAVNPRLEGYPDIWKFDGRPIAIGFRVLDKAVIAEHWGLSRATWDQTNSR